MKPTDYTGGASDQIQSREQVKILTELLKWANASDSDDNDRPGVYSSHNSLYGWIYNCIDEIVYEEARVDITDTEINWGGNDSWFENLCIAVDKEAQR